MVGALAAAGLSGAVKANALAGASASDVDMKSINPALRPAVVAMMKQFGAMPDLSSATLPIMRKMMGGMSAPPSAAPAVSKRSIGGSRGRPEVMIYIVNAQPGSSKPMILHTHGGGFVMGDAAGAIGSLQPIAVALDCVVVTVDYRLAPEVTFAGSIEDNYTALKWVHDHAPEFGVDRRRIAVMGESAGGGHAALLAITARDRGEVPIAFQSLIYPMLDDRTGSATTPAPPIGSIAWTSSSNRFGWQSFLGQAPGTATVPAAAVPARQTNLKGLPPAFIGVGSIDLFVDEDVSYARRLIDAGISVELTVVPGAFHGFDVVAPGTAIVKQFNAAKLNALRQAFSPG